jgi:DNA invertase Pin-like site-specific DNA recombinase
VTTETQAIAGLRRAAKRRRAANAERHAASVELRKRVKDAHEAGISPTQIAHEAGLSRQAVYEALGQPDQAG